MWVKANLNFDQYRAGKVYQVETNLQNLNLVGAAYFTALPEGLWHTRDGNLHKGEDSGTGEPDLREESSGGTGGGDSVGDPDESSDSDGGQEAGAQG